MTDRLRRAIAEGKAKLSAKKLAEEQEKEETRKTKEADKQPETTMKTRQANRKLIQQATELETIDCTDSDSVEVLEAFAQPHVRIPKITDGQTSACSSTGQAAISKPNSPKKSVDSQENSENSADESEVSSNEDDNGKTDSDYNCSFEKQVSEEEMIIESKATANSLASERSLNSFFSEFGIRSSNGC